MTAVVAKCLCSDVMMVVCMSKCSINFSPITPSRVCTVVLCYPLLYCSAQCLRVHVGPAEECLQSAGQVSGTVPVVQVHHSLHCLQTHGKVPVGTVSPYTCIGPTEGTLCTCMVQYGMDSYMEMAACSRLYCMSHKAVLIATT